MALEYRLTLAGTPVPDEVAARAVPDPADRPTRYENILSRDLFDKYGFLLTVASDGHSWYEAEGDAGMWEWEVEACVDVTFRMDKDPDRRDFGIRNMLEAVNRVLATGDEDAVLVLNGDDLLLVRSGGVITKHRRAMWWDHYGWVNEII